MFIGVIFLALKDSQKKTKQNKKEKQTNKKQTGDRLVCVAVTSTQLKEIQVNSALVAFSYFRRINLSNQEVNLKVCQGKPNLMEKALSDFAIKKIK